MTWYIVLSLKLESLLNTTLLFIKGLWLHMVVIMREIVTWEGCVNDTGIITLDSYINKTILWLLLVVKLCQGL